MTSDPAAAGLGQPDPEVEPATASDPIPDDAATGDPRVDAALAQLRQLDSLPTADQVPVLEDIHQRLQAALADLDGN